MRIILKSAEDGGRWKKGEARPFAFDPNSTENEGRFRLYPPKQLTRYFRRKIEPGISEVIGYKEKRSHVQALRFDKNKFSEKEARVWWADHKGQFDFYGGDE